MFVVEETASGSGIHHELAYKLSNYSVFGMNLGDEYVTHGGVNELYRLHGLDADSIARRIQEVAEHEN